MKVVIKILVTALIPFIILGFVFGMLAAATVAGVNLAHTALEALED